jgi:hypothetical protein
MLTSSQNGVAVATILACKQLGLITNLAPFDKEKAKKCTSAKYRTLVVLKY